MHPSYKATSTFQSKTVISVHSLPKQKPLEMHQKTDTHSLNECPLLLGIKKK